MHRFFCSSKDISKDKVIISNPDELHHLKDVLRIKENEKVIIFDDQAREYTCVVTEVQNNQATAVIKERHAVSQKQMVKITIACAIPKKSKMDDIIDKLTQLGVDAIIPLETARVIIKWDAQKKKLHKLRWEKIALNSSKQSQRSIPPVIEPVTQINKFLSHLESFDLKLIPTLAGKRKTLKEILTGSKPKNILVMIGPEGDFTEEEVDLAKREGCISVSLGELVLRVETAAVSVASFLKLYAND